MPRHILINVSPWETRVALLEDGVLCEVQIERRGERGIVGNVYKGRVQRVLPGMQAAFIDVGLEKAVFLHVSDLTGSPSLPPEVAHDTEDATDLVTTARRRPRNPQPIEERLAKGQELLVQVAKEPMGTKGARVTAQLSLPGRWLVYMPDNPHIGISRRIVDEAERERLRAIVEEERPPGGGFIIRTACEEATKREIQDDVRFLTRLWELVQRVAAATPAPALIHQELDPVLRTVRDLFTADTERLTIDAPEEYVRVREFVEATLPRLAGRLHLYEGATPIFDHHGIEPRLARALERRVWLKSGGYLIFEQTESLTTVDVNTGRYVGKRDQEETVLRTNLEAAGQIIQQLRLRNIGGIIVIDFIDMESPGNRRKVFEALQEATRRDKARSTLLRISELGLVQMTRKRTRESLERLLTVPCPHCQGSGRVRAIETRAYEALRRLQREAAAASNSTRLALRVHPEIAAFLLEHERRSLEMLEQRIGHPIEVVAVSDLTLDDAEVTLSG